MRKILSVMFFVMAVMCFAVPVLAQTEPAAAAGTNWVAITSGFAMAIASAVCGLGLDVVPLPGDTGIDELRGLLLDVAALAVRLDKPLSARLMPLPGKRAGDHAAFDDTFFAPTAVLPVTGRGASRLFAREGL